MQSSAASFWVISPESPCIPYPSRIPLAYADSIQDERIGDSTMVETFDHIGSATRIDHTDYVVGKAPSMMCEGKVLAHHRGWNVWGNNCDGTFAITGPSFSTKGEATYYALQRRVY